MNGGMDGGVMSECKGAQEQGIRWGVVCLNSQLRILILKNQTSLKIVLLKTAFYIFQDIR